MRVRVARQKPSRSVYSTNTREQGGHSVCHTHTHTALCVLRVCAFRFNPHAAVHLNFTAIKGKACTHKYKTSRDEAGQKLEYNDID